MPSAAIPTAHAGAPPQTRGNGLAVLLLAISAFVIVTTEFIIVGLLPGLARDLDISVAAAGQLVTLFAFTVMLAGPFLTAMLSHF
ncbi:MAG: MFS transporter, partial [Sphingomonas sp.]